MVSAVVELCTGFDCGRKERGRGWGQENLLVRAVVPQIEWHQKQIAAVHTQCPTPNPDSLNLGWPGSLHFYLASRWC